MSYFTKIVGFYFTDIIRRNYSKFIKMADLSDFKRDQIVGGSMVGAHVTKTAVARSTALKVMTTFEKERKKPPL